jgi:hypothetical protein
MITVTYYQVFCDKNKAGVSESVAACLNMEKALIIARQANLGDYDKAFRTGKPPYQVREMELDMDLVSKESNF